MKKNIEREKVIKKIVEKKIISTKATKDEVKKAFLKFNRYIKTAAN